MHDGGDNLVEARVERLRVVQELSCLLHGLAFMAVASREGLEG